jgi:hypothetical protein
MSLPRSAAVYIRDNLNRLIPQATDEAAE